MEIIDLFFIDCHCCAFNALLLLLQLVFCLCIIIAIKRDMLLAYDPLNSFSLSKFSADCLCLVSPPSAVRRRSGT